ncbi:trehalase family glycosidase, partial [Haloparvum sedimenti]|uniref:trehalase family glycosidase n=1 Tax=Haloparvum sedimenti TaxID=1678448 RepID=UPI001FDF8634
MQGIDPRYDCGGDDRETDHGTEREGERQGASDDARGWADRSEARDTAADRPVPHIDGPLFEAVQRGGVFADSKRFVDSTPTGDLDVIRRTFHEQRDGEEFDLRAFVERHFAVAEPAGEGFAADPDRSMVDHVDALWDHLTREGDLAVDPESTRIELPHPYVVPGGRFREIYYWDSYFTAEGLAAAGRNDLVVSMADDFAALVDRFGYVPNGTRTYFAGRSQFPVFHRLVELLVRERGPAAVRPYLSRLDREHGFWTDGADRVTVDDGLRAHRRVVALGGGNVLNRYWDDAAGSRPEAHVEDVLLAERAAEERDRDPDRLHRDVRAACESGWDFSSRWLADGADMASIRTTEIVPVDLNASLYGFETRMADWLDEFGRSDRATDYRRAAAERRAAVDEHLWNPATGFYEDYRFTTGERTGRESLAAVVPLFAGMASEAQAAAVAERLRDRFLREGGLVTTPRETGQQWDAPNGWAPLQ